MNYCLSCNEEIIVKLTWDPFVSLKKKLCLCEQCLQQLSMIRGTTCPKCNRPQEISQTCYDCVRWERYFNEEDPLNKNVSVFEYNEFMQDLITKWKYRGDYVLGEIYRHQFVKTFNEKFRHVKKEALIVPIPLSESRINERLFNQAEMLASFISRNYMLLLTRNHSEKQAKMNRFERMLTKNPFKISIRVNKPVILVDDIYTTGRTIRHAATILKQSGSPNIYSYTLIRG